MLTGVLKTHGRKLVLALLHIPKESVGIFCLPQAAVTDLVHKLHLCGDAGLLVFVDELVPGCIAVMIWDHPDEGEGYIYQADAEAGVDQAFLAGVLCWGHIGGN